MKLWKRFLALGAAAMLLMGALPVTAAPKSVSTASVKEADAEYYKSLSGKNGKLSGTPGLTIAKYLHTSGNVDAPDTTRPIQGVTFKYVKVGGLYEVTDGTEKSMVYGVTGSFAEAAGLKDSADYTGGSGDDSVYYYKNPNAINTIVRTKTKEDLKNFLDSANTGMGTTGEDGTFTAKINGYGLYLVVEYDTSGAKITENKSTKAISITKTQRPFVVALPRSVEVDGEPQYWEENVTAEVKNSTGEAEVEKKIVTGTNAGNDLVDDTDTASIGDTVQFRLKGTIPAIPDTSDETIKTYIFTDHISKGLSPVLDGSSSAVKIKVKTSGGQTVFSLSPGTDFEVSKLSDYTETVIKDAEGKVAKVKEPEYTGGKTITITFTEVGLGKLNKWAKDGGTAQREIYFYYEATVNDQAVIGPSGTDNPTNSGNPNEVQLTYQIGTSAEMMTGWDKVTEYTFGIDLTKQLAGKTDYEDKQKANIEFVLYREDKDGTTYYSLKNKDGIYYVEGTADSESAATKLNPQTNGLIAIRGLKGLEADSYYYLKELQTVPGYNILKEPVKITITADKGSNTYVADSDNGATNEYIGTVGANNKKGIVELAVNNTKGFTLPATGGAGIWLFVICGALVVCTGCIYFMTTKKRYEEK